MRLVLTLPGGALVEFGPLNDASAPWPYLVAVGTLRMAARAGRLAGLGVGESPNLDVVLMNNARQVTDLIGGHPLRLPAQVYDGAELFFDGVVSKVTLGRVMTLILES